MYHRDIAPLTNDGHGVKLLYGCVSRSFQHMNDDLLYYSTQTSCHHSYNNILQGKRKRRQKLKLIVNKLEFHNKLLAKKWVFKKIKFFFLMSSGEVVCMLFTPSIVSIYLPPHLFCKLTTSQGTQRQIFGKYLFGRRLEI